MKIINGIVYMILFALFLLWLSALKCDDKKLGKTMLFIKRHVIFIILLTVANTISFAMTFQKESGEIVLEKDNYGGQEQQVGLLLKKEGVAEEITLNVRPKQLTVKQCKQRMAEAFVYLEEHIKGENDSLTKVNRNLDFSMDYDAYPFDLEVQPADYVLIDGNGNVKNGKEELEALGYQEKDMIAGISTQITVTLWYGEESSKKVYELLIFPKEENHLQKQFSEVREYLQTAEKEALYEDFITLPVQMSGVQIMRTDVSRITPMHILIFGFFLVGLLLLREKEGIRNQEKKRQELLRRSYPWFVNELVLLLGAGMQVKNIFAALTEEYAQMDSKDQKKDYRWELVRELKQTRRSLELGMSEEQAYYQLGRRLKLPCYIKLMTLLEQNVRRGTKGLMEIFEQEELNALEERKNLARRYGEEAGTKLLGPMILLLLVIMLMIMIPAFMSF